MKYKPFPAKMSHFPSIDGIIRHIPKSPRFWLLLALVTFIAGWLFDSFVTFIVYVVDPAFFFENELNLEILALASSGAFPFQYFVINMIIFVIGLISYINYKRHSLKKLREIATIVYLISFIICFGVGIAHMMAAFNWIFKYIS